METSGSSIVDPGSILSYLILKEEHRWPRPSWRGIYRTLGSVALVLKDGRRSFITLDPLRDVLFLTYSCVTYRRSPASFLWPPTPPP